MQTSSSTTAHHVCAFAYRYTGKERDTESGNDYFGARYYASSMGRWLSPDPINLTNARLMNPANTLNKYVYGANNPIKYVDPDGKDITIYYRAPNGGASDFGHIMLGVLNQDTGKTAFVDFYQQNGRPLGPGTFNPGDMAERGQQNANSDFASFTIQTNPEQAQALIDAITKLENGPTPDYSAFTTLLGQNCATMVEDVLKDLGLDFNDQSPTGFWQDVWGRYSQDALDNPFKVFMTSSAPRQGGRDYGHPRFNNQSQLLFALYWLQKHQDKSSVTTTQGSATPCGGDTGHPCRQ
jgi:RHS repeat-associated protein